MTTTTAGALTRRSVLSTLSTGAALAVAGVSGAAHLDKGTADMRITDTADTPSIAARTEDADAELILMTREYRRLSSLGDELSLKQDAMLAAAIDECPRPKTLRFVEIDRELARRICSFDLRPMSDGYWSTRDLKDLDARNFGQATTVVGQNGAGVVREMRDLVPGWSERRAELLSAWRRHEADFDAALKRHGSDELDRTIEQIEGRRRELVASIAGTRARSAAGLQAKGAALASLYDGPEELEVDQASDDKLILASIGRDLIRMSAAV